jgi:hypothetical protein
MWPAASLLQTEKGVLEAALQHEVTAQAGAQAQLNIFQAKLTEAVVDLEKRCAGGQPMRHGAITNPAAQ